MPGRGCSSSHLSVDKRVLSGALSLRWRSRFPPYMRKRLLGPPGEDGQKRWAMYRDDERARGALPMMDVRGSKQQQATLVDRLQLLLCCICALLPGGALLVSGQGAALSSVFRPLVAALHIPLTIMIFLLHPVALAIDGKQRQRAAIGAGRARARGAATIARGGRGIMLPGVSEQLWKRIRRACSFGVSYFGTAWCLLLILTIIGWIPWSETITAAARRALALLVVLHLVGLFLACGVLLLGRLVSQWNKASRR